MSFSGRGLRVLIEDLETDAAAVEDAAVDELGDEVKSVADNLSGLTILPPADSSVASYGWVGGGTFRAPPSSAPMHASGARPTISSSFSVASALTDVPSLRSATLPVASRQDMAPRRSWPLYRSNSIAT
jgi:hypothetical protein